MNPVQGDKEKPRMCVKCRMTVPNCKFCSACGVAYYCSVACQKAARPTHKPHCDKVKVQREMLAALRARLATVWESEEAFNANMGRYVDLPETADYTHARHVLAVELFNMGSHENNVYAFEDAEQHFVDLVKMSWNVRRGIHTLYPFVLINLGKIQDAYDFIKWNVLHYPLGSEKEKCEFVEKVSKGQNVFLVNEDMLEDLSNNRDILNIEKVKTTTHIWLTFAVIKCAIISGFGKVPKLGRDEKRRQQSILFKYCVRLQKNNAFLLKDLVDSFLDQENRSLSHPYFYTPGTETESQTLVAVAYMAAGTTKTIDYIYELLPKLPKYKGGPKTMEAGDGRHAAFICHSPFLTERTENSMGLLSTLMSKIGMK